MIIMEERKRNERRLAEILLSIKEFKEVLNGWYCPDKCRYVKQCDSEGRCIKSENYTVEDVMEWMKDNGV